jgi:lysophospholipase L1-like esterase
MLGRGISGQTTPQILVRFQQDVVALKPKVVVINAGTNDIAGNTGPSTLEMIEDNLKSMAFIQAWIRYNHKLPHRAIRSIFDPFFSQRFYRIQKGLRDANSVCADNRCHRSHTPQEFGSCCE